MTTTLRGPSQCDRILAVLSDGRPWRMEDIHRAVGFCRLNSRISEIRSRGHHIECDKTGGHYVYRLIPPAPPAPEPAPLPPVRDGQQALFPVARGAYDEGKAA